MIPTSESSHCSVQFSCSVVSDSLRPPESQHARLPVHHQLPESTQTHVHGVSDAIQLSHPLLPSSPPALNLSQHQGLFKWSASLVAQRLKRLPGIQETRVWSLGREDPLEKEMTTHSSTLAWRIPWREEPGRLQSMGSQRVGHDWETEHTCMHVHLDIWSLLILWKIVI